MRLICGIIAVIFASGSLFVSGCGGREEKAAVKPAETDGSRPVDPASVVRSQSTGPGSITVSVLPNRPTVKDDLRLVFSGAREISSCHWERNGSQIEPSDFECLPRNNFAKGDEIRVRVVADGQEVTTSVTIANAPPEVVAVPFRESRIHRGVDIEVLPEGADLDGDPVQFRYVWTINGEALSLDSPVLAGDRFRKGDRISLNVIPFDGEDEGRMYRGREVVVPNAPPSFVSMPPQRFKAGVYRYEARAEDPDGDAIKYALESAPAGMSIDSATGTVVWSIEKGQAGEHKVTIVAEDEEGAKAFQEYVVTISLEE